MRIFFLMDILGSILNPAIEAQKMLIRALSVDVSIHVGLVVAATWCMLWSRNYVGSFGFTSPHANMFTLDMTSGVDLRILWRGGGLGQEFFKGFRVLEKGSPWGLSY